MFYTEQDAANFCKSASPVCRAFFRSTSRSYGMIIRLPLTVLVIRSSIFFCTVGNSPPLPAWPLAAFSLAWLAWVVFLFVMMIASRQAPVI